MRLIDADKLIYQSHAQHLEPYINKKDIDNAPTVEMAEDCVKREDAIRLAEQGQIQGYEWQFKKLCNLPSVQPQPKRGSEDAK